MEGPEEDLNLARARTEYCAKVYKEVGDHFTYLEKKAEIFFSFITIYLGALFLNTSSIKSAKEAVQNSNLGDVGNYAFYLFLGILITSTFFALVSLASVIKVQEWSEQYPDNLAFSLYAPNSQFLEKQKEKSFLDAIGFRYALAIEDNRRVNLKKIVRLEVATWSIYTSIFSLFALLTLIFISLTA